MPLAFTGLFKLALLTNGVAMRKLAATPAAPAGPRFTAADLDPAKLEPAPIRPEWIIEGEPEARCAYLATGTLGWGNTAHWSCTAGRFRWHFGWDETVLILEGEVIVTDDDGTVYHGVPGTTLFFPAGSSAVWDVPRYVRKIAFNQRAVPLPLHIAERIAARVARLMGRG